MRDADSDAALTTTTEEQVPVPQLTTIELRTTVLQPTTIELGTTILLSTTIEQGSTIFQPTTIELDTTILLPTTVERDSVIFQPTTINQETTVFSFTTLVSELLASLTDISTFRETLTTPPIVSIATGLVEDTVSVPFISTVERTDIQPSVSFVFSYLETVVTQNYAFTETTTESAQRMISTDTEPSISGSYSLSEVTTTQSYFTTDTITETPVPQTTTTTAVITTSLPAETDASLPDSATQIISTNAIFTVTTSAESSSTSSTVCPDPCAVNIFATELIYPTRVETRTTTVITATLDTWITVLPDGSEITSLSTRTVLTLDTSSLASPVPQLTWTDDSFPGVTL